MTPVNVLIVQRRLTEYRVALFERLRVILAGRGIRLTVVHGTPEREEMARGDAGSLTWAFRTRSLSTRVLGQRLSWTRLPRAISGPQDLVVLTHENGIVSNYRELLRARLGGPAVAWWGHGPKLLGSDTATKERLKGISARWAEWYFAYTEESVARVLAAGVPVERITCVHNAVEREPIVADDERWDAERARLKAELGLGAGPVAVYLGSLTPEKRIPMLLAAGDALARELDGFRMLVVGDGPMRSELRRAAETRPWLRALGVRHGRDKALVCSLGHAMLNPGMVGLNIVDAFAMGLPLVTMRHELHSPEIAYLEDGRNGLIVDDDLQAFVAASSRALTDAALRETLRRGCREDAERYTLERMARSFARGIEAALRARGHAPPAAPIPVLTVAFVIRTFQPYHRARMSRLREALRPRGVRVCEIEVASRDAAYGFAASDAGSSEDRFCCFPGVDYQSLEPRTIHAEVTKMLRALGPDVVVGHATPFPEGMAAIAYRNRTAARVYVVDDAWAATDRSPTLVRRVKRRLHRAVDGAIVSSATHARYYASLGIPEQRTVSGWSVVDNEFYAARAAAARRDAPAVRARLALPERYFLFVGRFLERKGLARLLAAYDRYCAGTDEPWPLLLVGGDVSEFPPSVMPSPMVRFAGRLFGEDLACALALAGALVVPSVVEQWGLVINEAMASGTPVVASRACGGAQIVRDGESGWTYDADDVAALAEILEGISGMPEDARAEMGYRAQRAVSAWGLDRFVAAVSEALEMPRREPAGFSSRLGVKIWKGRVRAY